MRTAPGSRLGLEKINVSDLALFFVIDLTSAVATLHMGGEVCMDETSPPVITTIRVFVRQRCRYERWQQRQQSDYRHMPSHGCAMVYYFRVDRQMARPRPNRMSSSIHARLAGKSQVAGYCCRTLTLSKWCPLQTISPAAFFVYGLWKTTVSASCAALHGVVFR